MHDRIYRLIIRGFRILFRLLGLRFDIRGAQHLLAAGPAVLAINHISYLDFAFAGLVADNRGRLVRFLAKSAVFRNPVAGPFMRTMGHIPVDRGHGEAAYRTAERALQAGEIVGIFPEATISRSWELKPFKSGAAALAVSQQVPIVPMIGWGGQRILTVDGRWSLRRRTPITLLVGDPFLPEAGADVDVVSSQLRERMQSLLDQAQRGYPDRPTSENDRWWLPARLGGNAPSPAAAAELDAARVTH